MINKKNALIFILSFLSIGGISYFNIEDELPVHKTKKYKFRSLDRPLYITFHHTATKGNTLKQIANYHVEQRGFPGIAYHFAINSKGEVFQLQQIDEISYHSKGRNTESLGIVFIGNYQDDDLSKEAIRSGETLVNALKESLCIIGVRGHRDVRNTLCPGDKAYQKIKYLFY
tara:strand:- start:2616 stop:3131 length:516 start_codon:yes stop_codon:yes gene_type:complete